MTAIRPFVTSWRHDEADAVGGLDERDEELHSFSSERVALLVRRVTDGRYKLFAAYVDGELVSVAHHVPVGNTSVMYGVGTLPDFRGRGLARAVVTAAVNDAFTHGISTVVLTLVPPASFA